MAYTTPNTSWVAGDPVLASDMNRIEGNIAALKDPPASEYDLNEVSDYTTSSTSFVDVDATNLALTITTTGGDVVVGFHATLGYGANSQKAYFDVDVDGSRFAGDDGIIMQNQPPNTGGVTTHSTGFVVIVTGLSAGSHTFKLQWKVSASTATLYAGAGTSTFDLHPQFFVREI